MSIHADTLVAQALEPLVRSHRIATQVLIGALNVEELSQVRLFPGALATHENGHARNIQRLSKYPLTPLVHTEAAERGAKEISPNDDLIALCSSFSLLHLSRNASKRTEVAQ